MQKYLNDINPILETIDFGNLLAPPRLSHSQSVKEGMDNRASLQLKSTFQNTHSLRKLEIFDVEPNLDILKNSTIKA